MYYQVKACPSPQTIAAVRSVATGTEALSGWQDRHPIFPSIKAPKKGLSAFPTCPRIGVTYTVQYRVSSYSSFQTAQSGQGHTLTLHLAHQTFFLLFLLF